MAWLVFSHGMDILRERFLYKLASNSFRAFVSRIWRADAYIGHVSGNVWTELVFDNCVITDFKGCPGDVKFKAGQLKFSYKPMAFFLHDFDIKGVNVKLHLRETNIPIEFNHASGLTTMSFKHSFRSLECLNEFLPGTLAVSGQGRAEGELVLKRFKPQLVNISLDARKMQFAAWEGVTLAMDTKLSIKGDVNGPFIKGDCRIHSVKLGGKAKDIFKFIGLKKELENKALTGAVLDVGISGSRVPYDSENIKTILDLRLVLLKNKNERPYLDGKIEARTGTYKVYDNEFKMDRSALMFSKDIDAGLDINMRTRIGRTAICMGMNGTLKSSRLTFAAKPDMSKEAVAAFLIFGGMNKGIDGLSADKVMSKDFNSLILKYILPDMAIALDDRIENTDNEILFRWKK